MAYEYIRSLSKEDDDQNLLGPSQSVLTQGGNNTSTSVNNSAKAGARPAQKFANINDYIGANKGYSGNLAGNIIGNLDTQQNQIRNDINSNYQNFQTQVGQGTNIDQNNLVKQAQGNALSIMADPNKANEFQNLLKGEYKGPTTYETPYQNKYQSFTDAFKNYKTDSGRNAYLQGQSKSLGNAGLNNALLANNQAELNRINQYADTVTDLKKKTEEDAQKKIDEAKAVSKQTADQAKAQLESTLAGYSQEAQNNLSNIQKNQSAQNAKIQQALSQGDFASLNKDELNMLGITDDEAKKYKKNLDDLKLYGKNVDFGSSNYLQSLPSANYNLSNTVNPQRAAEANALASLLGQSPLFGETSQAVKSPLVFNEDQAAQDLQSQLKDSYFKNFSDRFYKDYTQTQRPKEAGGSTYYRDKADLDEYLKSFLSANQAGTQQDLYNKLGDVYGLRRPGDRSATETRYSPALEGLFNKIFDARNYYQGI
jgi:hypothetical protein